MLHTVQIGLFEKAGSPLWTELRIGFYCQDDINPSWVVDRLTDLFATNGGYAYAAIVVMHGDESEDLGSGLVNPQATLRNMEQWINDTPGVRFLA